MAVKHTDMKKIFTFLTLFCLALFVNGQTTKVLFIGNSYTAVNNLPQTVADIALSKGDSLAYDMSTPGGYTFNLHTSYSTTLSKINSQPWDYVVLQEQSQLPSFDPAQVATAVYPYARSLDSLILLNDSCTETVFYMTWGRQNGDLSNCAVYPPVCTYVGMQQRLRDSYLQMAISNHSSVSPVGVAWKHVRDNYPGINLYQADESHPSVYGTYLAACVFYSTLFHKSAVGSGFLLPGISASDGLILQTIGSSTVLDSVGMWQGNGDIPSAGYTYIASGNTIQFNNTSLNSSIFNWDFGDGSVSGQTDPLHTYTANGQFIVNLLSSNDCFSVSVYDTITITAADIPKAYEYSVDIYPNPVLCDLFIDFKNSVFEKIKLELYNSNGQVVLENEYDRVSSIRENLKSITPGLYFVALFSDGKRFFKQKIIIK